mgnify:FL=1
MTALFYLLPILTCLFLYSTLPVSLSWEYYACCVGGSWLLTALIHWLMYRSRISDDEFLGSYINKVTHEEAWTELVYYIERVPCGRDSNGNTIYKNVQRVRHVFHPELWEMFSSYGTVQRISHSYYDQVRNTWGTPESRLHFTGANIVGGVRFGQAYTFEDILSSYAPEENPLLDTNFSSRFFPLTEEHEYENKVRNSHSIFKFEDISAKRAKELGLFDYPPVKHNYQECILGRQFSEEVHHQYELFNAWFGFRHQLHVFILCFNAAKGMGIAEKQRAYWEGGNRNEFVVCLGLDGDTVRWCHAFSWMDEPVFSVKAEAYFREHEQLDLSAFCTWLQENVTLWKRKDFHDFDYLTVSLTSTQNYLLLAFTLAVNVGIAALVMNMIEKTF